MKNFIRVLFIALILMSFVKTQASSYVGADLTYTCLGGTTYLITFSYYKDCSGSAEPSQMTINFNCSSNTNLNFTTTFNKIFGTGQEVTPGCCDSSTCNGGTNFGVREFVYSGTTTIAPCNAWTISANGCCRNTVNSVSNGSNNPWYLESILNNQVAPGNSSPTFSNKPIAIVCQNYSFCYNQGALDPDGDSLVYSFVSPRTSITGPVTYSGSYYYTNFLSCITPPGITLHPITGDICFNPAMIMSGITCVKVEEWRNINGVATLIGATYRDLQFRVRPCLNEIPILSGMDTLNTHTYNPNDTVFLKSWHVGQTVDFDINGFDADTATPNCYNKKWEYHIIWNNGIPSGSFSPSFNGSDSAYAHFNWVPTLSDVSTTPHCFTASIQDDACPYYGLSTFSYCIIVKQPVGLAENDIEESISIFPNPTTGIINITFNNTIIGESRLEVYSMDGRRVYIENWSSSKSLANKQIDLSPLPEGVYQLKIENNENTFSNKIIIRQ